MNPNFSSVSLSVLSSSRIAVLRTRNSKMQSTGNCKIDNPVKCCTASWMVQMEKLLAAFWMVHTKAEKERVQKKRVEGKEK